MVTDGVFVGPLVRAVPVPLGFAVSVPLGNAVPGPLSNTVLNNADSGTPVRKPSSGRALREVDAGVETITGGLCRLCSPNSEVSKVYSEGG